MIVLIADRAPDTERQARQGGAADFLTKPYDRHEIVARVCQVLKIRVLERQRAGSPESPRASDNPADVQMEAMRRLGQMAEYRDDATELHIVRMSEMSACLTRAMGMSAAEADVVRRASPLHDVGKITIPDRVLLKTGEFQPEELALIRAHATAGARILAGSRSPVMQMAATIASPITSAGTARATRTACAVRPSRWSAASAPCATCSTSSPPRARTVPPGR